MLRELTIEAGDAILTLESKAFSNLPSLRELSLARTPLSHLPGDLLQGTRALLKVNLSGCTLAELPKNLLHEQENMTSLDVSNNWMTSLHRDAFWSLRSLQLLDLSYNYLEYLPPNVFDGLTRLHQLHIDRNRLTTISLDTFRGPTSLHTLTLSQNNFTMNEYQEEGLVSPFTELRELKTLNLSRNCIEGVAADWRISWVHRERLVLDLSWNKIGRLEAKDIQFRANVTVDLRYNEITTIEVGPSLAVYPRPTFLLDHNPLNCDCILYPILNYTSYHQRPKFQFEAATCTSPNELQNKTLATLSPTSLSCKIGDCPKNCTCIKFPASSSIEMDCLHPPPLKEYPNPKNYNSTRTKLRLKNVPSSLDLPIHVYALNLSHSYLVEVPLLPVTVQELDLRWNQIAVIPSWLLQRNVTLHLPNNTLQCDCDSQEDLRHLQNVDHSNVLCKDGRALNKLDVEGICNIYYASLIGGTLAVIGILSIVFAVVVYIKVGAIKQFIYRMGWDFFIYEEELDGRHYDVLVSYADEMEKFVAERFVPVLEDEGYAVSVRYRDWNIGDWVPGKVAQLVEKSRRTVVILSPSYLGSLYSLEMEAALMSERRGKWKRVLPVLTKDFVPDEKLSALLEDRACLELGEEAFWRRLKKMLPKRRAKREVSTKLTQRTLNILMTKQGDVIFSPP